MTYLLIYVLIWLGMGVAIAAVPVPGISGTENALLSFALALFWPILVVAWFLLFLVRLSVR